MAKKPKWKVLHRYICRSSRDPESMARGMGLGLFVGFLPSVGFQIILALLLAGVFNANRIVAMAGTLVTNPFTALPLSAFSLWLGDWILPGTALANFSIKTFELTQVLESPGRLGVAYLVGCLAMSVCASMIGYGGMKVYYQKIKSNKRYQNSFNTKENL